MSFTKVTEQDSNHNDLEKKSVKELVEAMHEEDNNALNAIQKVLPEITNLIEDIAPKMKSGGRLFYIGAGTSGAKGEIHRVDPTAAGGKGIEGTEFASYRRQL